MTWPGDIIIKEKMKNNMSDNVECDMQEVVGGVKELTCIYGKVAITYLL